jgi:hypothetical protein
LVHRRVVAVGRRCKVIGWLGKRERRADLAHILFFLRFRAPRERKLAR